MYVVLSDQKSRTFYGHENPRAFGPFMSSREALEAAGGDPSRVVSVHPIVGLTDRFYWRDLTVTEVFTHEA